MPPTQRPDLSFQRVFEGTCAAFSDAELAEALEMVNAHLARAQTRLVHLQVEHRRRHGRAHHEHGTVQHTLFPLCPRCSRGLACTSDHK